MSEESNVPPNQSVYVNNLNEKVKIEELKKSLYHVFSQFGNVLEIHAMKHLKWRGQAWVVYDDLAGATKALREMQGFSFYGKPMRVQYAKIKSDVIAKADGTFMPRPKRKIEKKGEDKGNKKQKTTEKKKLNPAAMPKDLADTNEPNNILFVEYLPDNCTQDALKTLFSETGGFKEARLVPGKPGIAFVEFADIYNAGRAKEVFNRYQIATGQFLKITYAKQ
eukprot:gb/GEZN01013439.1/.p1 GENE.gb/GEZN01013439.1/~~gb/GEZN01013439.1/.p1  ORF type:complete len:222 (-),score=37.86 gb/GEZN01013439.1/:235-900(-)